MRLSVRPIASDVFVATLALLAACSNGGPAANGTGGGTGVRTGGAPGGQSGAAGATGGASSSAGGQAGQTGRDAPAADAVAVVGTGGTVAGSDAQQAAPDAGRGGATGSGGRAGTDAPSSTGGRDAAADSALGGRTGQGGTSSMGGAAGALGTGGQSGAAGSIDAGSGTPATGPCDIFGSGSTPCVAAHSTVRALYGAYDGSLYQVRRASDNTTKDIGVLSPGGFADAATQDTFCAGTTCLITTLYDQSGKGNHLEYQGQGSTPGGQDKPASATGESLSVSGHKVYSLYINPGNSYWRDGHATGVPTGSAAEGIYMVTSGTHVNSGCCFDYGNSETDRKADGAGAMDAIYFGTSCWFGGCSGTGPWVQADLEYGLFPGGSSSWNTKQVAFTNKYVTAMLKNNGTTKLALKGGNAQSGSLTVLWDGALPSGYNPMKKQGAIVLGSGGDCCSTNTNMSLGTFYEGAMVSGYPSDTIDASIQSNIVAAGYGTAAAALATAYETSTRTR